MARLTIPDEQTYAEFTVVTSTSAFPITFSLFAKADLTVYVDDEALGQSDFTFSGTRLDGGGYDGGTVTLNSAVDDVTVRIERNVSPTRTSNFAPANSTPVQSIDLAFNRLAASQQDLKRKKLDAPTFEVAGKYLAFDADGEAVAAEGTGADAGLRTDLASEEGASLVGFTPPGAGGIVRSVETRLREGFISVLDYYQASDGADHGPAFGRALAASQRVTWPSGGSFTISSVVNHTLTTDVVIDWNGALVTFAGAGRVNLKSPFVVSSGRTLASNAARWATSVVLNSGADIQAGDILNIQSTVAPTTDVSEGKQDTLRVRSVSGATVTLEDGLNFAWNTGDSGLNVVVLRPAGSVTHRNPNLFLDETDGTAETRLCVYHEGVAGWVIDGGSVRAPRPFDREANIYRNGFAFYYSLNGLIRGLESEAMSYPVLIAGGSRYVREENSTGRYNHHTNADMGGWASDYELIGLDDQDSFVALSTHACFRAKASRCNVRNNTAITAWRCCGGAITDSYLHTTDSTSNTVQMQYYAPASGYEYIYTDRGDFTLARVQLDNPNRSAVDVYVRYGARVVVEAIEAYDVRIGANVVQPVIKLPLKLAGGKAGPTKGLVESTGTQVPAPDLLDAYLDSAIYHIDPYRSLSAQSGKVLRCRGQIARNIAGGAVDVRIHYNAFPGLTALTLQGPIAFRVMVRHESGTTSSNASSFIEYRGFLVAFAGGTPAATLTEIGTAAAVTPASGAGDVTLSVAAPTVVTGTDGYIDIELTVGVTGGVSNPAYQIEYDLDLTLVAQY